jgi:hypothetical protein
MSGCVLGSGAIRGLGYAYWGKVRFALNRCMQPTRPWRQDTLAFCVDDSVMMEGSSDVLSTQSKVVFCSGVVFVRMVWSRNCRREIWLYGRQVASSLKRELTTE